MMRRPAPDRTGLPMLAVALFVFAAVGGCMEGPGPGPGFEGPARPSFEAGRAVVAVVDTGVNPYHDAFRLPGRDEPAGSIVPGYPVDAGSLALSLDAATYADALEADRALWAGVRPGVLYDVPGTALVGVVSFGEPDPHPEAVVSAPGLDEHGHGSAALGMVRSACANCLLVAVETAGATDGRAALDWLRTQSWVDVVVYPARAGIGFVGAATHITGDPTFLWGRANVEAGQFVVVASGNGPPALVDTGLAAAYAPLRDVSYSYWTAGPDWVLTVGALDSAGAQASDWHTYPVDIVAEGVRCQAPHAFSLTSMVPFGGTSCSAPVVGGQVGRVLVGVREGLGDGATGPRSGQRVVVPEDVRIASVSREDVVRAFLLGARDVAPGAAPAVPEPPDTLRPGSLPEHPVSAPFAGWGTHDDQTLDSVVDVLLGRARAQDASSDQSRWFAVDQRVRLDAWGPWDRGTSRVPFPEPWPGPVRAPGSAADVLELHAAAVASFAPAALHDEGAEAAAG